jgi:hypothetical protein
MIIISGEMNQDRKVDSIIPAVTHPVRGVSKKNTVKNIKKGA